jgi:sterol desaturase/sphingolipid hydroxylase (fatty acid hydroxylase superfamily)
LVKERILKIYSYDIVVSGEDLSNPAPSFVRQLTINYDRTPVTADVVKLIVPAGERPINVVNDTSVLEVSAYSILRYMYAALILYSFLVSYVTGCFWYTMLLFYLVEYIAFYLWHFQAHHRVWWIPFNEGCYNKHKEHHWELYPPKDFYGARKRQTSETNNSGTNGDPLPISWWDYMRHKTWISDHEGLLILLTFIQLVAARLFFHCSYSTIGCAFFGFMIMAFIGNWLHHAYHVEDHWLERFKWFHELRALHYIHHLGTAKHNYGVLNMTLDRFLGSFTFSGTKVKTKISPSQDKQQ